MNIGKSLNLEKKISYLLLVVGFLVFCFNFFGGFFIKGYSFLFLIAHPSINTILLGLVLIAVSSRFFPGIEKKLHIVIFFMIAFLGIMDKYNNFYGIGQIVLALLLMYKYGFLTKNLKLKLLLVSVFYVGSIELSIFISEGTNSGVGLEILIYTAFFLFFLYLIYQNEFEEFVAKNQSDTNHIDTLRSERKQLNNKILELEEEKKKLDEKILYSLSLGNNIDINNFGLTKTELKIVKILINKNMTNKDIADELNVTENTIKTHLYRIFNKIGIGSRAELIGMFNYIELT